MAGGPSDPLHPSDHPGHNFVPPYTPPRNDGLYVVIPKSELEFIKAAIVRAEHYALEARDSSRANHQTLTEVVKPKLDKVDEHEVALQRSRGAMWAVGAVWTAITVALTLWVKSGV